MSRGSNSFAGNLSFSVGSFKGKEKLFKIAGVRNNGDHIDFSEILTKQYLIII